MKPKNGIYVDKVMSSVFLPLKPMTAMETLKTPGIEDIGRDLILSFAGTAYSIENQP